MIINNSNNTGIETVSGEISTYSTTIDPKDLDFITTILTTNLYSNPEESFIREIVSNAWDSHVEAGNTDTPVIIKIQNNSIFIRDYGTGISPERFKSTFLNIGSSTKRSSNKYIGAYGIGRLSGLACSNTVYFTSYYNGTMYSYVMSKISNKIEVTKLYEEPTTENNGLSVALTNVNNIYKFKSSLSSIVFFPNIYIEDSEYGDRYNSIKNKRFKNFAVLDSKLDKKYNILIGNVLYPLDETALQIDDTKIKNLIYFIKHNCIFLTFDIGELDITPNRENIIYTNKCIDKIKNKINKAYEEIIELLKDRFEKDYNTINDLKFLIKSDINFYPFEPSNTDINVTLNKPCISIKSLDLYKNLRITFRGYSVDECFINIVQALLGAKSLKVSYYIYRNVLKKPDNFSIQYGNSSFLYFKNSPIYIYPNDVPLKHRKYIARIHTDALIVKDLNYIHIYKELLYRLYNHNIAINSHKSLLCIFQTIYKHLLSRVTTIDENSSDYKLFAKSYQASLAKDNKITLHIMKFNVDDKRFIRHSVKCDSLDSFIAAINRYSKPVIISRYKESPDKALMILRNYECIIYEASTKVYNTIMNNIPNKVISIDHFMSTSSYIQRYYDERYLYKKLLDIGNYSFIKKLFRKGSKYISYKFSEDVYNIFRRTNLTMNYEYINFLSSYYGIKPSAGIDEFLEFVKNVLAKIDEDYKNIIHDCTDDWILDLLIIKSKLFIINYKEYNVVNNNLIYKLICKKRK